MNSQWLTKGSLFIAITISGLSYYTTKTFAEVEEKQIVQYARTNIQSSDDIKKIEIYDTEAMKKTLEEIVSQNPLYQLNNKSVEEIRNDLEKATITYQGFDMNIFGVQDVVITIKFDASTVFKNMYVESIQMNVKIEFIDTTAPLIELSGNDIWINKGIEFNIYDFINSIHDNSLRSINEVEVIGQVDNTTEGEYGLIVVAKDLSGNVIEEKVTVHVVNFLPRTKVTSSSSNREDFELFLSLVNAERARLNIAPLQLADAAAQEAAMVRAVESTEYLAHIRIDGTKYYTALDEQGIVYVSASEVLTNAGNTVYSKFNWWMNSPGHKAILLDPKYTFIAIGTSGKMWAALLYQ